jgi:hypothetical protein
MEFERPIIPTTLVDLAELEPDQEMVETIREGFETLLQELGEENRLVPGVYEYLSYKAAVKVDGKILPVHVSRYIGVAKSDSLKIPFTKRKIEIRRHGLGDIEHLEKRIYVDIGMRTNGP